MSDERPSTESLREVKAEYKARRKAEEERAKAAKAYWDQQSGRTSSKGRGPLVAVGVLVAAAAVVGTGYVAKLGPFAGSTATTSAAAPSASAPASSPSSSASAPASPTASAAPGASASDDGTDPTLQAAFEDTPAAGWKPGVAGIVMPKARTVGIYQPRQVADAYAKLATYLQHVMLDPRVQFRGKLDSVFASMNPRSVTWIKQQHALFQKSGGKKGYPYGQVAVRFRPGDWRAADATRVRGKVTAKPGTQGSLELDFVYVAAYWLQPRAGGAARAVAVRLEGTAYFYGNGPRKVDRLQAGFLGMTSTAGVCGSTWPDPEYVEAWTDLTKAGGSSGDVVGTGDLTDPDATLPTGCIHDTSGF